MAEQEFAYRASAELEAAVRDALARVDEWERTVFLPWCDAHPGAPAPLWVRQVHGTGVDRTCVGFADVDPVADPPEGLSRNRKRRELVPVPGAVGEPWREAMRLFNTRPTVSGVFALHGVETYLIDFEHSRAHRPGVLVSDAPGESGLWLKYAMRPRDCGHLTPVPVSSFYQEMERLDAAGGAREAQRVAVAAGGPVEP